MNYPSNLPFELGEVSKGTDADGNIITPDWAGKIHLLTDSKVNNARTAPRRTGRQLLGVPALNNSGITLLGKRLVRFKRGGGFGDLERVDGYSAVLAEKGLGFVDEYLSSVGVADKYYFWVILQGPILVLTPSVNTDMNTAISIGNKLVAATGATSGNSTSGRVSNVTFTNATAGETGAAFNSFNMAANIVAVALSARTSDETSSDLLVNACIQY